MKQTKRLNSYILVGCFLLLSLATLAQKKIVSGKIFNTLTGIPISSVTIHLEGYPQPFLSNAKGEFLIHLSDTVNFEKSIIVDNFVILEIKPIDTNIYEIYVSEQNPFDLSFDQLLNIKVNVSSSKSETVFRTPSTVSVIDQEIITKYNFLNVAELIRIVAGLDIYQTNNDDNIATIRGILQNYYANKILVLINSIPTYQPIYGNTNLDRVDINDIERIEVLKGPASVLYGSNAYLGVVNIILKETDNGEVNVRLGAGYRRFGASGANVTYKKNDFSLFISGNSGYEIQKPYNLTGRRQDVYLGDTTIKFQRELKSTNFNISTQYKFISFLVNTFEYQHTFLGINPSFISGAGKPMTDRGTLTALKLNKALGAKTTIQSDLAFDYFKRDYSSNQDLSNELVLSGNRLFFRAKLNYKLNSTWDFETGVDFEKRMHGSHEVVDVLKDTIIRSNLKNAKDIAENSAFAQIQFNSKILNILAGMRYTNNSFSGNNISSRITLLAELNKANSLKLIYGESFRAPTMLELFFDHPTVIGNENLKPEEASTWEFAYVFGKKNAFIQALIYYNKLTQLIQRITPNTGPPSEYRNVSWFESYGFEFESKFEFPGILDAYVNYNFMKGMGLNAKSNFQHVPKHTASLGLNKSFNKFFISANSNLVSQVLGNPKLNITIEPQYFIDLHIGFKHQIVEKKIKMEHRLSAKNITSSKMLIPEYVRQTDNINSQATMANGFRLIYILSVSF